MLALMFAGQRPGHWWGDDWALYVRQAQGLVDGEPGRVASDNTFSVTMSRGAAFSPPVYPWGFPLLLAPFVAAFGTDLDRLAIVPMLSACAFACAWYAIAKRRLGTVLALLSTIAATITPVLLSWTELIQSEWPFLAVTFVVLAGLDRAIESQVLTDVRGRWWPLVLLGVGAAAAFTVRREGLAMAAAIAAAQLGLLTTGAPTWRALRTERDLWLRLLVPHLSALAGVLAVRSLLPSVLVPSYSGTGIHNVWGWWDRHIDHLAEISGLKSQYADAPAVLGSTAVGWVAVGLYFAAAAVGAGFALVRWRRRDLHLVVYALVAFAIGASFRSALNRYVATVAPVLFLLGLVAAVSSPPARRRWVGTVVATAAVLGIIGGNIRSAERRVEYTRDLEALGVIEWGPTHPAAIEMFEVVEANSAPDDVVAGPKARALTLMTDRRAVQVDQWRELPLDVAPALVVVERDDPTEARMRSRYRDAYVEIWSNSRFVVFGERAGSPSSSARS
jgi:4-amino-4-deoxy-L-arabinose transferase-like glycosyltransferase